MRIPLAFMLSVLLVAGLVVAPASGAPSAVPADVDVLVVVEIQDVSGWLTLHQEVLAATDTARPLSVTLPARTGGNRMIGLEKPKFTASLAIGQGTPAVKVAIAGKVRGTDALTVVTPFQHAALDVQAGVMPNEITLVYGLSGVVGRLLELHISRI